MVIAASVYISVHIYSKPSEWVIMFPLLWNPYICARHNYILGHQQVDVIIFVPIGADRPNHIHSIYKILTEKQAQTLKYVNEYEH